MSTTSRPAHTREPTGPRTGQGVARLLPVVLVWGALFLNVLTFSRTGTVVPIPETVGKLITQAAAPVAVLLAIMVNRRAVVRPNLVLALLSVMAVVALAASVHNEYLFPSAFRAVRMLVFLGVLWLISPWFGRRDMLLLRCHRLCLCAILGSVYLGVLVSPGLAFAFDGRLAGVIWPIPPTQVAHYAAVLLGISVLLWMCRVVPGRSSLVLVLLAAVPLFLTHTRTALLAAALGLAVACASLFLGHVRVRRTSALGTALGIVVATVFASQLTTWVLRGESAEEVGALTGRTKVWSEVFALDRPPIQDLFGSGLSNQSFDGLPIDSNWVAGYLDQGWFGVAMQAAVLLVLLLMAVTHVRGPQRAVALFLVIYCLVASITETGLGAPSTYFLDLTVALALLLPESRWHRR
jgi:hypothetical protein